MFLKDRVMAEQFDKENTEQILQSDLDQARQEIGIYCCLIYCTFKLAHLCELKFQKRADQGMWRVSPPMLVNSDIIIRVIFIQGIILSVLRVLISIRALFEQKT